MQQGQKVVLYYFSKSISFILPQSLCVSLKTGLYNTSNPSLSACSLACGCKSTRKLDWSHFATKKSKELIKGREFTKSGLVRLNSPQWFSPCWAEDIKIGEYAWLTSVNPTMLISGWVKQAAGMLRWFRMLSRPLICSTTTSRCTLVHKTTIVIKRRACIKVKGEHNIYLRFLVHWLHEQA